MKVGTPVVVRVIAHLGLANLYKSADLRIQTQRQLNDAQFLAYYFAPRALYDQVLFEIGFLNQELAAQQSNVTEQEPLLDSADQAYSELLSAGTISELQRIEYTSKRANVSALRNDWSNAINTWRDCVNKMDGLSEEERREPAYIVEEGDLHNNLAVGSMHLCLWAQAYEELKKAASYRGGDDRKTRLNEIICLDRLRNFAEASNIANELEPTTERDADYVLFGWSYHDQRRTMAEYSKALHRDLPPGDLPVPVLNELADICNREYLGLHFEPADFSSR